ncbi:MAG: hypothetical protein GYA55_14560 [SAR324 cluster bacterium]|uniref:Uncharacterized protein n=1 Tax=SAR324 cluster bacterium TaxID=2024889 RepID=A0A7X9FV16_9DELT|nr:hypothetical protein [SAR324 cluster bacterium]
MKKTSPLPPLEQGLNMAMKALDNQIARMMQRNPNELEKHGAQKWEPFQQKTESLSAFLLEALGNRQVELDSLLVFAQAFSKALAMYAQEMEEEGLGKIRSLYCRSALENIMKNIEHALRLFDPDNSQLLV